jgi:hypothetical protein
VLCQAAKLAEKQTESSCGYERQEGEIEISPTAGHDTEHQKLH